jgi:hypothetical protein
VNLAPVSANRQCFLTRVWNIDTPGTPRFNADDDAIQIWNDGYYWWLGGSGNAGGQARCVDVNSAGAPGALFAGGSTATWNMTQGSGTQCLLQGLGGDFLAVLQSDGSYAADWNNGVFINYDPSTQWWSLKVSPHKKAWVNCVQ